MYIDMLLIDDEVDDEDEVKFLDPHAILMGVA
jgi:hypothetical protein